MGCHDMHAQDVHVSDLHVFLCLQYMSLSCVLDPAIIVLDLTCACGIPWAFLLAFFSNGAKWKCCNFFVFDNNANATLLNLFGLLECLVMWLISMPVIKV